MPWFKDSWGKDTSFDDKVESKFWKEQEEKNRKWWATEGKKMHKDMQREINKKNKGVEGKSLLESFFDLFS